MYKWLNRIILLTLLAPMQAGVLYNPVTGWISAGGGATCPTPTSEWLLTANEDPWQDSVGSNDATEFGNPTFISGGGQDLDGNDGGDIGTVLRPAAGTGMTVCGILVKDNAAGPQIVYGSDMFQFTIGGAVSKSNIIVEHTNETDELLIAASANGPGAGTYFMCWIVPASTDAADTKIYIDDAFVTMGTATFDNWDTTPSYSENTKIGDTDSGTGFDGKVHRFAVWDADELTGDELEACCDDWNGHHSITLTCS